MRKPKSHWKWLYEKRMKKAAHRKKILKERAEEKKLVNKKLACPRQWTRDKRFERTGAKWANG